jgi:recombination protein RecT
MATASSRRRPPTPSPSSGRTSRRWRRSSRPRCPPHVSVEKFKRVAMTAIQNTPALVNADRRSLFGAFVRLAQDGLLPDGREAAVVMFGNKAQAMPMIAGILKKIRQSGEVAKVSARSSIRTTSSW